MAMTRGSTPIASPEWLGYFAVVFPGYNVSPVEGSAMAFSDDRLGDGTDISQAQYEHPFVVELAAGTLDQAVFLTWVRQNYRYLLNYARTFAMAGATARDEATVTHLLGVAHEIPDFEMELHREFAADDGLSVDDLESMTEAPTCVADTNFLVRTASEGSLAEIGAAIYPCGQGYLDVAEQMADLADGEHRYTPCIEK